MMSEDQLQFIDYRKPALEVGNYSFTTTHQYSNPESKEKKITPEETINICVKGERVAINAEDIYAQYPPKGATGEYSDTIPHIALKKGALPWSRSAYSDEGEEYEPWLFLMLINQADIDQKLATAPMAGVLSELKNPSDNIYFPSIQADSLANDNNLSEQEKIISYVDIDITLFNNLIAKQKQAIKQLAHIRRRFIPSPTSGSNLITLTKDEFDELKALKTSILDKVKIEASSSHISLIKENESWLLSTSEGNYVLELESHSGDEYILSKYSLLRENAVLMANRFAQTDQDNYPQGMRHYSLLISLENYLDQSILDEMNTKNVTRVRLLVTHHWWFNCTDNPINFSARCEQLDVDSLRLPADKIAQGGSFSPRLAAGLTGIDHKFRLGDHSVSWYRGPLAPCDVGTTDTIHLSEAQRGFIDEQYIPTDADKLLVYLEGDGMFDISHAAAYELGRFLSLAKPSFMQALMNYKRKKERYVRLKTDEAYRKKSALAAGITIKQLPYAKLNQETLAAEQGVIENWLFDLARLKNIPSWYLLPDNQLLPRRTLRVFNIDPQWVQSLWLGALSLGGRPKSSYELFTTMHGILNEKIPRHGMLLRSDIVWAYPQLDAKFSLDDQAKNEQDFPLEHRLANDVQLYLCQTPFKSISLALPLESLHYGVDMSELSKKDVMQGANTIDTIDIPFYDADRRIINVDQLCKDFYSSLNKPTQVQLDNEETPRINPAQLGRYLIEGEPKAIYKLGENK